MNPTEPTGSYRAPRGARAWLAEPWRTHGAVRSALLGVALGFALPALVVATLWAVGAVDLSRSDVTAGTLLTTFVAAAVLTPLFEEIVFRYLMFRGLEWFLGSWTALAVSGALFGVAHLMFSAPDGPMEHVLIVTAGTLAGIFFAAGYLATRALWLPIGLHAGWNAVTNVLVGPDRLDANRLLWLIPGDPTVLSGGSFGSDASILTSAVLLAASLALLRRARRNGNLCTRQARRRAGTGGRPSVRR